MADIYPYRRKVRPPVPLEVKPQLIRHFSIGILYPLTEEVMTNRWKSGLDPVPPTVHRYPEAVQDIRNLIKAMQVDKNIGLDMKTMEYCY